ncbi:MAG: LamG-like jellyroll fold domain-containing protein, partial [Candidatus Kariarchaeaceae archaeon]
GFYIADGTSNEGSPSASIEFDSWIHIVGIVDRTNNLVRIFKNGTEVGTGTDISGILSLADTQNLDFQCAYPTHYFDGLLDEIRVLNQTRSKDWIKTEYYNQYDPNSFYSIGQEQGKVGILYSNLQVNTIDFFGNPTPNVNISIYNGTTLKYNSLANNEGIALFANIIQGEYNFTATITSSIGGYIENVNTTTEAILINQTSQTIDLVCNVGSNFFKVVDIDGIAVTTGWLVVGNSTQEIQNCSIDGSGQTRFWWVKTSPYEYNYTLYYKDNKYNPNIIKVASGDIITANSSIQIQAALTTIDFTVLTLLTKQPASGVKCLLSSTNTGESIVNLTTDNEGKATLRWLNSSGINSNYSLQLEFFGSYKLFNMTSITKPLVTEVNFTVSTENDYNIYVEISLGNYETELISLNPTEYISVKWGSQLNLMMLFNVSKAIGAEHLLGPVYSDEMAYQIFKGADLVLSGKFGFENDYEGVHYAIFNTGKLESDVTYLVMVSAQKSGYSLPENRIIQLNVLKNDLILNQSENDDSIQSVYWTESLDLSVKPYGEISESFTSGTSIFQNVDHSFRFSLPDLSTNWNLSQIVLNVYNISWNVNASAISLSILNPYGVSTVFNTSNHAGWDYSLGVWEGLTLSLNKVSPSANNYFEFFISGTFDNTIDVIADAYFIRDHIDAQYVKYNNTNSISILSELDGWAIKNISLYIQNCYNTTTWQKVDLSTLSNLNITTVEGVKYSLYSGDVDGSGVVIMDDRIFYPKDNQFL